MLALDNQKELRPAGTGLDSGTPKPLDERVGSQLRARFYLPVFSAVNAR